MIVKKQVPTTSSTRTQDEEIVHLREFRRMFLVFGIFCLLFLLLVGKSLGDAWPAIRGSYLIRADEWNTAQGKIESVDVSQGRTRSRTRSRTSYHLSVDYTFVAEGTRHKGGYIRFGNYLTQKDRDQWATFYRENPDVVVYYERGNPQLSVLQKDVKVDVWIYLILIPVLGGFIIYFTYGFVKANSQLRALEAIAENQKL